MEERVIPPDEKDWTEMVGLQEDEFLENILFHRMKIYVHKKMFSEALLTIEFLGLGVVLKCHGIKSGESHDKYFYLQLSDNSWVKGLVNKRFNLDTDLEIRDGSQFIRLIISLETKSGVRRRILRKKIEGKNKPRQ